MALCLEDACPRVAALAQLFIHELAKKEYKVRGLDGVACSQI